MQNAAEGRDDALHWPPMDALRVHRLRAGLSQEDAAKAAGVDAATVRSIERGQTRQPHPETMRKLAIAVRVQIADVQEFADAIAAAAPDTA